MGHGHPYTGTEVEGLGVKVNKVEFLDIREIE